MKIRPIPTGIVDWKTIAPVMLPSASASLPSRTQKKLLTFSGSSVASGARISARTRASTPRLSAIVEQLFDEEVGAADHRPEADQELDHAERRAPDLCAARRGGRRSAGRASPRSGPRRRRAGCGGRRSRRRAGSRSRPGSAPPPAAPRRAARRAAKKTRKKSRSRSRVGPWTSSLTPCSRLSR